MAEITVRDRIAEIRGPGRLFVASDLHGNLEDFRRMVELFEGEEDSALLFLGDLFHGPGCTLEEWRAEHMTMGDWYPDRSTRLLREYLELIDRYPNRVVSIMGNHEHAHIGGPRVAKFYFDEAAAMESLLTDDYIAALRKMIIDMPLIATTDCGIVATHATAPTNAFDRESLGSLRLEGWEWISRDTIEEFGLLGELLWNRRSSHEETMRFLVRLRRCGVNGACRVLVVEIGSSFRI